jgi:type IV secretory pathway ATPase VirB11/archaellum biosynthesis ATPase
VIGGTGGGKTTLTNGLIHEVTEQFPAERIVIIEDTGEIQCSAKNYLQYHTSPEEYAAIATHKPSGEIGNHLTRPQAIKEQGLEVGGKRLGRRG